MSQHPLIVGIGELLWDRLPSGKRVGGAPANVVYHASCLGAEGYAVSAVGKDKLGDELLDAISETTLHTAIERVDYPTGSVHVTLNYGIPEYNIVENVAWDYIPLTDNEQYEGFDYDLITCSSLPLNIYKSSPTLIVEYLCITKSSSVSIHSTSYTGINS